MAIYWAALLTSFVTTAIGQVVYKYYAKSQNFWHLVLAIAVFAVAPFTSYVALKRIGIGMVFIGAAFSQILVLFLSQQILKEQINRDHVISMFLIVLGLGIYAFGI